jgi:hypothetical protein
MIAQYRSLPGLSPSTDGPTALFFPHFSLFEPSGTDPAPGSVARPASLG